MFGDLKIDVNPTNNSHFHNSATQATTPLPFLNTVFFSVYTCIIEYYRHVYVCYRMAWGCCGGKGVNNKDGDVNRSAKKVDRCEKVPCFAPGDILHFSFERKQQPRYIHVYITIINVYVHTCLFISIIQV